MQNAENLVTLLEHPVSNIEIFYLIFNELLPLFSAIILLIIAAITLYYFLGLYTVYQVHMQSSVQLSIPNG